MAPTTAGDAASATITKVERYGVEAEKAFGTAIWTPINLKQGVEYWVNASITDFVNYIIKP